MDVYKHQVMIPLVNITCDYKRPLEYGDTAVVQTRFVPSPAAKIIFHYTIFRKKDMAVAVTGTSTQVFLNSDGELLLISPDFFKDWRQKWGV
jgi:acyl-CoA thioester hydrolase